MTTNNEQKISIAVLIRFHGFAGRAALVIQETLGTCQHHHIELIEWRPWRWSWKSRVAVARHRLIERFNTTLSVVRDLSLPPDLRVHVVGARPNRWWRRQRISVTVETADGERFARTIIRPDRGGYRRRLAAAVTTCWSRLTGAQEALAGVDTEYQSRIRVLADAPRPAMGVR